MHRPVVTRLAQYGGQALAELPPPYLAPSLHFTMTRTQSSNFSTTPVVAGRGRDLNRTRGVSAIHRTGPRFKLNVSKYPLPKPVAPGSLPARNNNPEHGLWGFFPPSREALSTPEFDLEFGRSWAITELRDKSWEDIHSLWWVCVKERNRIATTNVERERLKAGYGDHEAGKRDQAVFVTMQNIKHVLRERWHAWEEAQRLYDQGSRPAYEEVDYMESTESVVTEDKPVAEEKTTKA
ncbi:54S ribosomal protein L4 [Penicillium angulare]|uniref:Large ribosomal subunit protein uL29m n=1 Tax=Penicillium angulare TaxID=116970 RepID=A0A9W9K0I1_9EURO|nr:54S ribosomal protein L4 [Penicillium angulare]